VLLSFFDKRLINPGSSGFWLGLLWLAADRILLQTLIEAQWIRRPEICLGVTSSPRNTSV